MFEEDIPNELIVSQEYLGEQLQGFVIKSNALLIIPERVNSILYDQKARFRVIDISEGYVHQRSSRTSTTSSGDSIMIIKAKRVS